MKTPQNTLVDALEMPDGRIATIEAGSSYLNHWHSSGFNGHGYLVCIDGEPIFQCAFRRDALKKVQDGKAILPRTQTALDAFKAEARS